LGERGMARPVKEWVGKNDSARPHKTVLIRLFEAAKGLCQQCGAKFKPGGWDADHRVRLRDGGENRENNLQLLCKPCHRAKTGQENSLQAQANRIKVISYGIKKKPRRLLSRKMDGTVKRWNPMTGKYDIPY